MGETLWNKPYYNFVTSQQLALLGSLFPSGKSPTNIITQNFLKFPFQEIVYHYDLWFHFSAIKLMMGDILE
jgi:hypothetical protein